jgi:hypothetical protein|nr:MAG TPA_asm: DNA polymerase B [Caudoviricetes sp.]
MKARKFKIYACDFETTVFKGQTFTEVWSACFCELYKKDVKIMHSIHDFFNYFFGLNENIKMYFHNLKFDGSFILSYLLKDLKYSQAYEKMNADGSLVRWLETKDMKNSTIKYSISERGQWYYIIIKKNNKIIEIRDSLKLLPFSLESIGKSFDTEHKKLKMEYEGYRYAGCEITPEEQEYIKNDVLVLKEALEIMFDEKHDSLTIGSCCLNEYKNLMTKPLIEHLYPNIAEYSVNVPLEFKNADEYVRKSYKGGWCYLKKGCENKIYNNGTTADVNSLYPSVMHSESGNYYPVGLPTFWSGNYIPEIAKEKYYFIRIKTRFYLKKGFLPCIQIKNTFRYKSTEWLETSDFYDKKTNKYYKKYLDINGNEQNTQVILTLTMTDFELIKEHYNLIDFEILDGCYFNKAIGIFDSYINKYKKIKLSSKGAKKTLAKLYLNNLYGKTATNTDSSFKVAYIKDDLSLGFYGVYACDKKPFYIPVGSAITSYARNFTIRAAQKNYNNFIYADTDSIHCNCSPNEIKGITVDDKNFLCWKLESCWDKGLFVRQKTYIEHITAENLKPIDKPFYNVKCAGMPEQCKTLFLKSIGADVDISDLNMNDDAKEFLKKKRTIKDFKAGLSVPLKLRPVQINGGVLLTETFYTMT